MRSGGAETRGLVRLRQSWSQRPGLGAASMTTDHRDPDADTGIISSPFRPGPWDVRGRRGTSPLHLEPGLETGAAMPSVVNQPPPAGPRGPPSCQQRDKRVSPGAFGIGEWSWHLIPKGWLSRKGREKGTGRDNRAEREEVVRTLKTEKAGASRLSHSSTRIHTHLHLDSYLSAPSRSRSRLCVNVCT